MTEIYDIILEILEEGTKDEYKLEEIATKLAEAVDDISEVVLKVQAQLEELIHEVR